MKLGQKALVTLLVLSALLTMTNTSHALTYTYASAVRWDNGVGATPSATPGSRYNQSSALGSPNANPGSNTGFLSLGMGGLAVFDFGVDFDAAAIVFETTNGRATYPTETARVYVADSSYAFGALDTGNGLATISPSDFILVGSITNATPFTEIDLSFLDGPFRYVMLQDITTRLGSGYDGFDVDAVGVTPIPEPGSVLLLGLGIAGLAICGKRRKNSKA